VENQFHNSFSYSEIVQRRARPAYSIRDECGRVRPRASITNARPSLSFGAKSTSHYAQICGKGLTRVEYGLLLNIRTSAGSTSN